MYSSSDSAKPFPDLNLTPHPPTIIVPKIEPKAEPYVDVYPPTQQIPATVTAAAAATATPPLSGNTDLESEFSRITDLLSTVTQQDGDVSIPTQPDPNSRAMVAVPNPDAQRSNFVVTPRAAAQRKYTNRSSELVRVTDLKAEDQRYLREVIRQTRLVYDSLRALAIFEDDKQRIVLPNRRSRADLKASQLMRECGLWLHRDKRIVGDIPGIAIGEVFFYRMEMCVVGLHGQPQAGIDYVPAAHSSNGEPIATSIIVSGGYEDDEDAGDVIVYTGHGGQDVHNRQVAHQKLESGNLALERSMHYGLEVRVIRGFKYEGSVGKIYVYDGLYRIVNSWFDVGRSGFGVFKFRLHRIENQAVMGSAVMKFAASLRTRPLEVRPKGYVTLDLSKKKENFPVFFYNDIDGDHDPIYYQYISTALFPHYVYTSGNNSGCECVAGCFSGCSCAMRNGGEFAYDYNGNLVRGKPLIFECGPHCSCPPTCRNRLTQKGIKNRFEVFRSRETGWGVRSLDLINAGSFICEYAGVVLTREQVQLFTMNGDSLIHPRRFGERWKEWGDLRKVFSDYVCPSYPSIPPLDFAIDVSRMRNLACYMSHSPLPNVFVQLVLYDHNNVSFPHLMLFAMENIPPMRELSLDYLVADEWMGKLAICN